MWRRALPAAPLLLFVFGLGACSRDTFIQFPTVDGVEGWLVLTDVDVGVIVDVEESAQVDRREDYRLLALPVGPSDLGISAGPIALGVGRPLPILAAFSYKAETWVPRTAVRVELPFDPLQCTSCLTTHPCETCLVATEVQGCGPCSGAMPPEAAALPTDVCPDGWQRVEDEDRYWRCVADRPPGYDTACADGQRWSIEDAGCVDAAPCAVPAIDPTRRTVYVDPAASPGGDGTAALPLQAFPDQLADVDVVFAATDHTGPIRVSQPGVRLMGHGACSTIISSVDSEGVVVRASGVEIRGLRIESDAGPAVFVDETFSATIADSFLMAAELVLAAPGRVALLRSAVVRSRDCAQDCSEQTVFLRSGSSIVESDIVGSPGVAASGTLTVTRSRVVSRTTGETGIAVDGAVTIAGLVVTGFALSLRVEVADEPSDVSDIVVLGKRQVNGEDNGYDVHFLSPGFSDVTVRLSRADIFGEDSTLGFHGVNAEVFDVRAESGTRAVQFEPRDVDGTLRWQRGWIDYQRDGIRADNGTVELFDVALRRCTECDGRPIDTFEGGITGRADKLLGQRIYVQAMGDNGIAGFATVAIDDLTVRDASLAGVSNAVEAEPSVLRGARWDIKGRGIGVEVRRRADLTDLEVVSPSGTDFTPICLRADASVSVDGFRLEPSAMRSPIVVNAPERRQRPWSDIKFRSGRVVADRLVRASHDCELDDGVLEILPSFDDVALD